MVDIGVTATTISNPLLLRIIKDSFPQLKVRISVFTNVDHAKKELSRIALQNHQLPIYDVVFMMNINFLFDENKSI